MSRRPLGTVAIRSCLVGAVPLVALLTASCNDHAPARAPHEIQHSNVTELGIAGGEKVHVYRMLRREWADGSVPSLQLEFESPVSLSDTAALVALVHRIWPSFSPYVRDAGVTSALFTATHVDGSRAHGLSTTKITYFTFEALKDSAGQWLLVSYTHSPLPRDSLLLSVPGG